MYRNTGTVGLIGTVRPAKTAIGRKFLEQTYVCPPIYGYLKRCLQPLQCWGSVTLPSVNLAPSINVTTYLLLSKDNHCLPVLSCPHYEAWLHHEWQLLQQPFTRLNRVTQWALKNPEVTGTLCLTHHIQLRRPKKRKEEDDEQNFSTFDITYRQRLVQVHPLFHWWSVTLLLVTTPAVGECLHRS